MASQMSEKAQQDLEKFTNALRKNYETGMEFFEMDLEEDNVANSGEDRFNYYGPGEYAVFRMSANGYNDAKESHKKG